MKPNKFFSNLIVPLALILPPLLLLASVTIGNKTIIPTENLVQFEPWKTANANSLIQAPETPHNALLSDLVLENYAWKRFIRHAIETRQIPLWNPYLFAGTPFLGNGQHSTFYPFSILFYLLPLAKAYGWFILSQYVLAGINMYLFARTLRIGRWGSLVGATIYQISLFMVVSAVFPMIIAGAVWLPMILVSVGGLLHKKKLFGKYSSIPWISLGAISISLQILAGHPEIVAYSLLIAGAYAAWHSLNLIFSNHRKDLLRIIFHMGLLIFFGLLLGAIQLFPLIEAAANNFRVDTASLTEVREWGYPVRRIITLFIPNFFGNPSHHGYFDWFSQNWTPVSTNVLGEQISTIDWGIKNYVEGGMYVGILPLLLVIIALTKYFHTKGFVLNNHPDIGFFLVLTVLSLSFVFGTPLYALIYYMPGLGQLHSPFRWVWPLTICLATLAAYGTDGLRHSKQSDKKVSHIMLARISMWIGAIVTLSMFLVYMFFNSLEPMLDRALWNLAQASKSFADTRMFFSYQSRWILQFGIMLSLSGFVLWKTMASKRRIWKYTLWLLIVADLLLAGQGFNASSNPKILDYKPPIVDFLQQDESYWRFTTYDPTGDKILNANAGWLFDMEDVRGYDSIIPAQYVDYMKLIEPQNELKYNRISPITSWKGLHSPLLDMLNVKYVISEQNINSPDRFELVYEGELLVYQNKQVLPRAYTLPTDCVTATNDVTSALQEYDPHHFIVLETQDFVNNSRPTNTETVCQVEPAQITSSLLNEVQIEAQLYQPGYLVLADSYSDGWKAFVHSDGNEVETRAEIIRANGNFRALYLDQGKHYVRFSYSPLSFRLGGVTSTISIATLLLFGIIWVWQVFYTENTSSEVRTVAKNSLAPMGFNLLNRSIDFIFAMFYLRMLGPSEAGNYATAIVIIGWFEIWTNFGLNTWLTREASRNRDSINQYLSNSTIFRLVLGLLTMPVFLGAIALYQRNTGLLGGDTVLAIILLAIGMIFSSISTGLTAVFYAYEKAEHPAAVSSFSTILKVALGLIALILGYGFVGLAGVSIMVNVITMITLFMIVRKLFFRPHADFSMDLQRNMTAASFPLMINHLLATVFFKIDIPMIRTMRGQAEVGRYSTAYKFIEAFNIIPAFFTFALFPLMSRQAENDRAALTRTYHLAIKLLFAVSLPLAVITSFLATPLVRLLGGQDFLPEGALALQLMIWSIPFGWINSVTNYLMITIGQIRVITRSFIIATVLNIVVNAIFIPVFGFRAAALSTILSEIILGVLFQWTLYRQLNPTPWIQLFGKIVAAAAFMSVITWIGLQWNLLLGLIVGISAYISTMIYIGVFDSREISMIVDLMPQSIKDRITSVWQKNN